MLTIRHDCVMGLLLTIPWSIVLARGLFLGLGNEFPIQWLSLCGLGFYFTGSAIVVFFLLWLKGYWQRIEFA